MQIANPIYDVVFKYLLDDEKVAKLILSGITGLNIKSVEFKPTEKRSEINQTLTVLHLDFVAKVKERSGKESLIIIEIQKAKLPSDIMRFRRYLGEQYMDPKNIESKIIDDEIVAKALPILSIYFLGHKLQKTSAPVVKVNRTYTDIATGEAIKQKEEFIESLTHDSYIIQIPFLKNRRRTNLEVLLSVFDQENKDDDEHILNVREEDYPAKYRPIIRRLLKAIAEPEIRRSMDIEDEIIRDMQIMERLISSKQKLIEEKEQVIEEKEHVIEEKEQVIEEKEHVIEEKEQVIEEKEHVIEEKEQVIEEQNEKLIQANKTIVNTVKEFKKMGLPLDNISKIVGISVKEIKNILNQSN